MFHAFIEGFLLALGLILPLGVQNIFIFTQGTKQPTFLHAIPSVLTASLCDAVLIVCSVLSISIVALTLPWLKMSIYVIGFIFLIYMGSVTWRNRFNTSHSQDEAIPFSAKKQIIFTLSVSLLNPHALMDTIGVIGTHSLQFVGRDKWAYTFACILVSFTWFIGLSTVGKWLKAQDKTGVMMLLTNQLSAIVMFSVAGYLAWQALVIL